MVVAHGELDVMADPSDVAWLLNEQQSGLRVSSLVVFDKSYKDFGHDTFEIAADYLYFKRDILPVIIARTS